MPVPKPQGDFYIPAGWGDTRGDGRKGPPKNHSGRSSGGGCRGDAHIREQRPPLTSAGGLRASPCSALGGHQVAGGGGGAWGNGGVLGDLGRHWGDKRRPWGLGATWGDKERPGGGRTWGDKGGWRRDLGVFGGCGGLWGGTRGHCGDLGGLWGSGGTTRGHRGDPGDVGGARREQGDLGGWRDGDKVGLGGRGRTRWGETGGTWGAGGDKGGPGGDKGSSWGDVTGQCHLPVPGKSRGHRKPHSHRRGGGTTHGGALSLSPALPPLSCPCPRSPPEATNLRHPGAPLLPLRHWGGERGGHRAEPPRLQPGALPRPAGRGPTVPPPPPPLPCTP